MHKIGLVNKNRDRLSQPEINVDLPFKQNNNINLSSIQQNNNTNQLPPQLGYINYSQPNSGRRGSLGQALAANNTSLNQQQGASFIGLVGSNQNQIVNNNSSINMSSIIRNGNINQTRAAAQQFLQPNPLRNDNLKVSHSLPQLFTNQNNLSQLNSSQQQPLNQSQLQYPQYNQHNSEVINRSYQRERLSRTKLNQSTSLVSMNGGVKGQGRKSFYHHSNIFNLKHYKNLTDHIIDGTDIDEIKNNQRSLLIREFRYKVDQYLLFSKYRQEQATREFNQYYTRIQDQLFKSDGIESHKLFNKNYQSAAPNGGLSFFSINNEDQNQSLSIIQPELNKSLLNIESNRFNYSKLSKQEASLIHNINVDIYLEDQFGKQRHTTHKLNHRKLQDYIIDKMKPYLSNDTEYDKKIEFFTQEYERILEKIQKQSFRIKVPYNYEPQMQPFNEYYKVDQTKVKDSQFSWQEIEDNLMNQVLQDSNVDNEEIEEEMGDEHDFSEEEEEQEESSYEEVEVIQEEIIEQPEEINKEDQQKSDKTGPSKQSKGRKSGQTQENPALQIFGDTVKVKQVMKIVKKKKKKNKDQDSNQDPNALDQQIDGIASAKQERRTKKAKNDSKERSAMDDYIIFRNQSQQEEKQPKTQKQQTQNRKPVQPPTRKIAQPMVGTPKNKNQTRIPPLRTEQGSPQRVQSIESPRPNNSTIKSSHSDSEEEVIVFQEEIVPQTNSRQNIVPKEKIENIQLSGGEDGEEEPDYNSGDDNRQKKNTNNTEALDMSETPKKKKVTRKVTNQSSIKSNAGNQNAVDATPRERKGTNASIKQKPSLKDQKSSSQRFKTQESKNEEGQLQIEIKGDDGEEEEEEEYEEETILVNEEIPGTPQNMTNSQKIAQKQTPRGKKPSVAISTPKSQKQQQQNKQVPEANTPKSQYDQTPKSVRPNVKINTPQSINTPTNQMRQDAGFSYFQDVKIKKKVGTGLIDDLVKVNYLLEFNVQGYKKDRHLPDIPGELEFKQEQDKQLFDAIFKWQYEVDLDITELEATLNKNTGQQRRGGDDSDDDDEDDRNRKRSSVHSSDITDFGEPAPDNKSLQNVSSDGLSDVE